MKRLALLLCLGLAQAQAAGPVAERSLRFVTESFPPFTFEQGGQAVGPMVDVLYEACRRLRWHCEIEVMPWRRALTLAEAGRVDGIFTVVDIPERRAAFHISPPVVKAHYSLYTQAGQTLAYRRPADLAGREVGVYGPSATARTLQDLLAGVSGADVRVERDNLTVLRKLAAGRYGANGVAMVNRDVASWLINNNAIGGLKLIASVRDLQYSFGLSRLRTSQTTADEFASVLQQLCREGRTRRIAGGYRLSAAECRGR